MYAERPARWNMLESLRRLIADPATYFARGDRLLWRQQLLPYAVCPLLVLELRDEYISHVPGGNIEPPSHPPTVPVPKCICWSGLQFHKSGDIYDDAGATIHSAPALYNAAALPPAALVRGVPAAWWQATQEAAAPDRIASRFDVVFTTTEGYLVYCTRFSAGASLVRVFLPRHRDEFPAGTTAEAIAAGWMYVGHRTIHGRIHEYFPDHRSSWVSGAAIITRSLGTKII